MHFWISVLFILAEIFRQCVSATTSEGFQTIALDSTSSSVTLTTPGFELGSYPLNMRQKWELVTEQQKTIRLTFEAFELEYHVSCAWDYVTLSNTDCNHISTTQADRICGIEIGLVFTSTSNVVCLEFVSDEMVPRKGFKVVVELIEEEGPLSNEQTTLSISDDNTSPSTSSSGQSTAQSLLTSALSSSTSSPSNETTVIPGISSTIKSSSSSQSLTTSVATTVSPPTSIEPSVTPSSSLSGSKSTSSLPASSTELQTYSSSSTVSTESTLSTQSNQNDITSSDASPTSVPTTSPFTSKTSLSNSVPTSSYSITKTTTSRYHENEQTMPVTQLPVQNVTMVLGYMGKIDVEGFSELRIITPKDVSGRYPVNFQSDIVIKNSKGKVLTFTFDIFRVEYHRFCSWDYLMIHDPNSNYPLCGQVRPNPFNTKTESIRIEFRSDFVYPDIGFVLRIIIHHPKPPTHVPEVSPTTSSTTSITSETSNTPSTIAANTTPVPTTQSTTDKTLDSTTGSLASKSSPVTTPASSPITTPQSSTGATSSSSSDSTVFSTALVESSQSTKSSTNPANSSTESLTFSPTSTTSTIDSTIKYSTMSTTTLGPHTTTNQNKPTTTLNENIATGVTSSHGSPTTSSSSASPSTVHSGLSEVTVCNSNTSNVSIGSYGELIVKSPKDENGKYPVNQHCIMNIRNDDKKNLMIKFTEFRIELNSNCDWDYLIVYTPDKHGPLCGYQPPSEMITQSDMITLEFKSDWIVPETGFVMNMVVLQDITSSATETSTTTVSTTSTPLPPSSTMTSTPTITASTAAPTSATGHSISTSKQTSSDESTSTTVSTKSSTHHITSTATEHSFSTSKQASSDKSTSTTVSTKASTHIGLSTNVPSSSTLSSSPVSTTTSAPLPKTSIPETTSSASSAVPPSSSSNIPHKPVEIDICSPVVPEFNDEMTVVSPGFSNGENYPLSIECGISLQGVPGESIIMSIDALNMEHSLTCKWDALQIQFGDQNISLCGYIPPTYNENDNIPCNIGTFVQFDEETNSRTCFLDSDMSHTFDFTPENMLKLTFVSDHIVARSGFRIYFKRQKHSSASTVSTVTLHLESSSSTTLSTLEKLKSTSIASTPSGSSSSELTTASLFPDSTETLPALSPSPSLSTTTSISKESSTPGVSIETPSYSSSQSSLFSKTTSLQATISQGPSESSTVVIVPETAATTTKSTPYITNKETTKLPSVNTGNTQGQQPNTVDITTEVPDTTTTQSSSSKQHNIGASTSVTTDISAPLSVSTAGPSPSTSISTTVKPTSTSSSSSTTDGNLPPACSSNGQPYSLSDDTGFIESPRFGDKETYPPNITCRWKIEDLKGQMISLIFELFDIEKSHDCRWDKLGIYETYTEHGNKTVAVLCGDDLPQTIDAASDVLIEFKSDSHGEKTGFRLKFLKKHKGYEDPSFNCLPGMTTCLPTNSCIPVEWICDGDVDCPDKSDEMKCAKCSDTEFSCGRGLCIDQTQRCDGYDDCPHGVDERDCVYLEEDNHVTVITSGKPLPLCYSKTVTENGNLVCRDTLSRLATSVQADDIESEILPEMALMAVTEQSTPAFEKSSTCDSALTTRITCKDYNCGRRTTHGRRKRVIGGRFSKQGEWPWSVALRLGQDFNHVICGGTIIDKEWVLTAGHCVKDLTKNPQIASIIAGVKNIYDVSAQIRYVTEVVLHPEYHYIFNADIALLKLDRPLIFNDHVQQICLPWDRRDFALSSRCFIAGWGISDMAEYYTTVAPMYLRHAKTKLVSLEYCNSTYHTHSNIDVQIHSNMICAGYSSGSIDACKGDSGGGLMCEVADGRWVQVGVTSWGDLCGSTKKPGVYTRVTSFVGWINETLGVTGNHNVNCTFETSDWCGYQALSNGTYIWTRKPIGKWVPGQMLYAIRAGIPDSNPANATLITPQFDSGQESCLGFQFLFSGNSNITLSIYGISEVPGSPGDGTKETLLWRITSHYPATESWETSETDVPEDVSRLKFVSLHEHGGISGLGLDNVTLRPGTCQSSNFMKCNFNEQTLCDYTNPLNTVFNKHWKIKHKSKAKYDYALETGGNFSSFGFMALSQLVSPKLTPSYASLPHCLTFSFYKAFDTPNELKVVTYSKIGQQLTNQRVFWSSHGAVIGQWNHVRVAIFRISDYFDHIVLEVRRNTFDDIYFMVDDIGIFDGYCV